eukprot:scaffold68_cov340-Pavlova_lutheri.AAC.19
MLLARAGAASEWRRLERSRMPTQDPREYILCRAAVGSGPSHRSFPGSPPDRTRYPFPWRPGSDREGFRFVFPNGAVSQRNPAPATPLTPSREYSPIMEVGGLESNRVGGGMHRREPPLCSTSTKSTTYA